jgi:hypothetical protein
MSNEGKQYLEDALWTTVEELERLAKRHFSSTPALPMDGNWITTELGTFNASKRAAEFVRAFKRESKSAKFLPFFNKPNTPYEYVFVYYENEAFPRGVIGFGTWGSVKGDGLLRYTIVSRRIENNKFAKDKAQHLMVATEKLDVAISHANTYLLQHNALEIARHFREDIGRFQGMNIDKADEKVRQARIRLLFDSDLSGVGNENLRRITDKLLPEALPALDAYALGRADRNEKDVKFHENLRVLAERKKEYENESNRCKVTWCVYVQVREHNVVYRTARVRHVELEGEWRMPLSLWDDKNVIVDSWYGDGDIADRQWLIGKLAVAETFGINQYVPNIGCKIATNVFFIEELEDDTADRPR